MSRLHPLILLAAVACGVTLRPPSASAQTSVNLNVPGITAIGAWNGRSVAATFSLIGCTYQDLGPSRLTTDLTLHGTAGNDTINVLTAPLFWCNLPLLPIDQNNHFIQTYGGAGDDTIYGGGASNGSGNGNWIFGEDGNDVLYMGPGGSEADGGAGNDRVYGTDNMNDILLGGSGNDVLCEHSGTVPLVQRGGDGYDIACSPAGSHGQFSEIEAILCAACGLGY